MAKEIAKSDPGIPAYLQNYAGPTIKDNFDESDVVIPMIKLLQGTSPECETFDDAKPGVFWHTGMDVSLGTEFSFIPCFRKKRYLLIAPMEDGQGVLARADDFETWDRLGKFEVKFKDMKDKVTWEISDLNVVKSGLDQWGTSIPSDEDSPPAATLFYDYIVMLPDHPDLSPVALTLTRSKIKKAKKGLNDKIALQANSGRPMQSLIFLAGTTNENNANNQAFKNVTFRMNGFASEEQFLAAQETGKLFAGTNYRVKGEETETDEGHDKAESKDF